MKTRIRIRWTALAAWVGASAAFGYFAYAILEGYSL